jgi:hypothetical protein
MNRCDLARLFIFKFGVCLISASAICSSAEAKNLRGDVVTMKNGDRLTGEVKSLEQGVLYIKMDYFSGSVGVDWSQVQKVKSTATYQITLSGGKRLTGTISKVKAEAAPNSDFKVHAPGGDVPARHKRSSIFRIACGALGCPRTESFSERPSCVALPMKIDLYFPAKRVVFEVKGDLR